MNAYFYLIESETDTMSGVFTCNVKGEAAYLQFEERCEADFEDFMIKSFNKL